MEEEEEGKNGRNETEMAHTMVAMMVVMLVVTMKRKRRRAMMLAHTQSVHACTAKILKKGYAMCRLGFASAGPARKIHHNGSRTTECDQNARLFRPASGPPSHDRCNHTPQAVSLHSKTC